MQKCEDPGPESCSASVKGLFNGEFDEEAYLPYFSPFIPQPHPRGLEGSTLSHSMKLQKEMLKARYVI